MIYKDFLEQCKKYPRYKIYATSDYMEFLAMRLKQSGEIWAWGNMGHENKKEFYRIS